MLSTQGRGSGGEKGPPWLCGRSFASGNDSGIYDTLPKLQISPDALQLSMKIVVGVPSPRRRTTRGEQAATAFTAEAAPEAAVPATDATPPLENTWLLARSLELGSPRVRHPHRDAVEGLPREQSLEEKNKLDEEKEGAEVVAVAASVCTSLVNWNGT